MTFAKFRFIPQYHSASPDFYYLYEFKFRTRDSKFKDIIL